MRRSKFVFLGLIILAFMMGLSSSLIQPGQTEAALLIRQMNLAQAQGQPEKAAQAIEQLILLQPWRTDLLAQLGESRLAAGDEAGAIGAYKQAYREKALDSSGVLRLTQLLIEAGDDAGAQDLLFDCLLTNQIEGNSSAQAIELLKKASTPDDILSLMDRWLEQDPTNAQALYLKGIYLAPTRSAQAALALEQAGAKDKGLQASAAQLLHVLDSAAQEEPAIAALQIGRGLAQLDEWQAAQVAFEQAVAAQPDLAEGWAFLAEAKQSQGEPAGAEIERALTLAPDSSIVQALAAIYYRRQGKPEIGLVYLHAAANQEPAVAYWQVELGKTLCELNDLQDALAHFLKATELEPDNADNWVELARFSLNYGIEPALVGLPAARKAVLLAPKDTHALDIMGALFLSQNDLASAERFLQQSLQQDRTNADAQLHLGQVYLASGELEAARPYLVEAARLTPETAVGKLAKRLIRQYYPLQ